MGECVCGVTVTSKCTVRAASGDDIRLHKNKIRSFMIIVRWYEQKE